MSSLNSPPEVHSIHPVLPVRNVEEAARFYVERLGFEAEWFHAKDGVEGNPATYGAVSLDGRGLHLIAVGDAGGNRPKGVDPTAAYFIVEDGLDDLIELFRDNEVTIAYGPVDQPYGLREVRVLDLDGNGLTFAQFSK